MTTERRLLELVCLQKNAENLSGCYEEEADGYRRQAYALAIELGCEDEIPDPDEWLSIAEEAEARDEAAKQAEAEPQTAPDEQRLTPEQARDVTAWLKICEGHRASAYLRVGIDGSAEMNDFMAAYPNATESLEALYSLAAQAQDDQ